MPISTKPSNAVKADAGEITKTLRWLARETEFVFAAEQLNAAAALIESMQAQLAEREREIERMREIIGGIVALASQGESVTLTEDLGENTLTICVGSAHTHCGVPDGSLDTLIDHLHALLVDGVGLSWATAAPEEGDSSD